MDTNIEKGAKGEALAVKYLQNKGYQIIETNWRFGRTEVDIIAKKDGIFIFIEVKTRSTEAFGYPEEAVNTKKQEILGDLAENYLYENEIESEIRFDIISIILNSKQQKIFHIEDAFFPTSS